MYTENVPFDALFINLFARGLIVMKKWNINPARRILGADFISILYMSETLFRALNIIFSPLFSKAIYLTVAKAITPPRTKLSYISLLN